MKKVLALILVTAFCLSLVACGNKSNEPQNKDNGISTVTSQNEVTESPTESEQNDTELPLTYKVPLKNIYVNVPFYQEIEEGYTQVYMVHESKYVAITFEKNVTANSVKEAHEIAFNKFKINMTNYEGGVNSISIEKEETKQINGLEVYCFEGKINYGTDTSYDGYAKGYAFIMDGVPCEIIGSVIEDGQPSALVDEISFIVDEMIKTAREEE